MLVRQLVVECTLEFLQTCICLPWNRNCLRLVFRRIYFDKVLQFVIIDIVWDT